MLKTYFFITFVAQNEKKTIVNATITQISIGVDGFEHGHQHSCCAVEQMA
jgi:hypothetical protein